MKYLNTLRGLLLTLLLVCVGSVSAHDFEVDGIYYNILSDADKTVEVTYKGASRTSYEEYRGNLVIPSFVTYDGVNYNVTAIGGSTFYDCINLLNIEVPNSVTSVGKDAFYNTQWYNEQEDGVIYVGKVLYKYKGNMPDGTKITIKNGTVCINAKAFDGYASLISIIIPNSVANIGCYAFKGCSGLTSITIPSSVMELGAFAFEDCTALKELIIEDSERSLYCQMDEMREYYNPSFVEDYFFEDSPIECMYIGRDLNNYSFPSSTRKWKKSLITVVFGDGITTIPKFMFDSCSGLISVTLSDRIKYIQNDAFFNCKSITSIKLPNELISIGASAFANCNLSTIIIPSTVTEIGNNAFKCKMLENIVVESGNPVYDSRSNCNAIIETSTNTLVRGCENTVIPNDVALIGNNAFNNCVNLVCVDIPNGITKVGDYAFYGCTNLTDVNLKSNPKFGTNAFPANVKYHLILDDGYSIGFDISNVNTYTDVNYSRNNVEGKYGTIILPFTPNARSLENYAFYELVESGDGYMKFEEVATPVANTPYIYTLREGKENIAITAGKTTISSTVETPVVDGWQTVGSFTNQALDTRSGNYYAFSPSKNEINKITKNLTVLPYRAYFKSDNVSKSAFSVYISGTTGIKEVLSSEIDGFDNEVIYDLSGRKILDPVRGDIYIINGKKVKF